MQNIRAAGPHLHHTVCSFVSLTASTRESSHWTCWPTDDSCVSALTQLTVQTRITSTASGKHALLRRMSGRVGVGLGAAHEEVAAQGCRGEGARGTAALLERTLGDGLVVGAVRPWANVCAVLELHAFLEAPLLVPKHRVAAPRAIHVSRARVVLARTGRLLPREVGATLCLRGKGAALLCLGRRQRLRVVSPGPGASFGVAPPALSSEEA